MVVGDPLPLLEARDLGVQYGGVQAINSLSFTMQPGERCGLIGPNGAGKTTLLDVLSGLTSPSSGSVILDGQEITGASASAIARHGLRRTFQRHQPFGSLTVEENVLVAAEWRGRNRGVLADLCAWPSRRAEERHRLERVHEVLEQCGLLERRKVPAANLPIGQIRLMEVARAIVDAPRLLLLDEPTSGLAQRDTEVLGAVITELGDQAECAFLLVEHDIDFVFKMTNRVLVLDAGRLLADGTVAEVSENRAVIEAYLGLLTVDREDLP